MKQRSDSWCHHEDIVAVDLKKLRPKAPPPLHSSLAFLQCNTIWMGVFRKLINNRVNQIIQHFGRFRHSKTVWNTASSTARFTTQLHRENSQEIREITTNGAPRAYSTRIATKIEKKLLKANQPGVH